MWVSVVEKTINMTNTYIFLQIFRNQVLNSVVLKSEGKITILFNGAQRAIEMYYNR